MIVLISILALAILGLCAGLLLGVAYVQFAVEEDPKVKAILAILPGANCGSCGFAGCHGFAEALVAGKIDTSGCLLGGIDVAKALSKEMGAEANLKEPKAAYLLCGGGCQNASNRFEYFGAPSCKAANAIGGGFKSCAYGCLGYGDCAPVCPVDAITMNEEKLPVVDIEKCIACGKCIKECPRDLFVLLTKNTRFHVKCDSHDKGAVSRKNCKVSCIACLLCQKACKFDAIKIENNLAVIDQVKCTSCGECIKVCPTKCIVQFVKG